MVRNILRLAKDPGYKTPKVLKRGIAETILGTEYGAKLLPTVGRLVFVIQGWEAFFSSGSSRKKQRNILMLLRMESRKDRGKAHVRISKRNIYVYIYIYIRI